MARPESALDEMTRISLRVKRSGALLRLALGAGALAAALWLIAQSLDFALHRFYNADEFRYAHAAWLFANGWLPYRDFWDPKFPFLYQLSSLVFLFRGHDPHAIAAIRLVMAGLFLVTLASAWQINRAALGRSASITPLLLLSIWSFVFVGLEIQPDGLATALFFAAIAALSVDSLPPRARGFLSGVLFALSLWTSQKAFCYAGVFPAALLLDAAVNRRAKQGYLLSSPAAFACGAGAIAAAVLVYLQLTGSLAAWYSQCIELIIAAHGDIFPSLGLQAALAPLLRDAWLPLLFAVFAVRNAAVALQRKGASAWRDPDLLLLAAFFSTFFAWFIQKGPFLYSLLPFMTALGIFAARGIVSQLGPLFDGRPGPLCTTRMAAVLAAALLVHFALALRRIDLPPHRTNRDQHVVLEQVRTLTSSADPVYDNAGAYVARPHAFDPYFTNFLMRTVSMRSELTTAVPRAIEASGCPVMLRDIRFQQLAPELQQWFDSHFIPYNKHLWVWGQRYAAAAENGHAAFRAVRAGKYFVTPAGFVKRHELRIDGALIAHDVFYLDKGEHTVSFTVPAEAFHIAWLPRNGVPFEPSAHAGPPRFSFIHYDL